jgi:hypothetical protein
MSMVGLASYPVYAVFRQNADHQGNGVGNVLAVGVPTYDAKQAWANFDGAKAVNRACQVWLIRYNLMAGPTGTSVSSQKTLAFALKDSQEVTV